MANFSLRSEKSLRMLDLSADAELNVLKEAKIGDFMGAENWDLVAETMRGKWDLRGQKSRDKRVFWGRFSIVFMGAVRQKIKWVKRWINGAVGRFSSGEKKRVCLSFEVVENMRLKM
ncbi:Uncharacterized protein Fot_24648 [Forsythia ovata]|uniref:Uncharacterized protein n=1 Tax=Forsythia ovata TaxID=205694 RepID=A0ABD1U6T8_9LAMI